MKTKGYQAYDWVEQFPGAITVCDMDGTIVEMNEHSKAAFAKDGGESLVGKDVRDCHPPAARAQIDDMLASGEKNVYTIEKKGIKKKIAASFGQTILNSQGRINRRKLADLVFSDGDKLSLLNSIIHPLVLARTEQLIKRYNRQKRTRAIVLDMPLLAEVGWTNRCNKLIFVDCKQKLRLARAKKKGLSIRNHLKKRENFQISLDRKVEISDNTVNNNSGFRALVKQVADIFSDIVNKG